MPLAESGDATMVRGWQIKSVLTLLILMVGCGCSGKSSVAPTPPATGPATLVVKSSPVAVPITLDGAPVATPTPTTLSLPAGTHTLGLSYLGYRDTTLTLTLPAASRETVTVALGPRPGTPRLFGTWLALNGFPDDLAIGPNGPLYVTMGTGTRSLLSFSLAGPKSGEASLNRSGLLTVAANGDAYLAEDSPGFGTVLNHYSSSCTYVRSIYYSALSSAWPGAPYAAMGTGDTLMVLVDSPRNGIFSTVYRYVNDQFVDLWLTGKSVGALAVDRAARRCYCMGASDTVYVLSTGGRFLTSWKCGLFHDQPGKITVGVDGTVYVADLSNIRRFTGDGMPLGAWGTGDIGGIWGLGVDAQGRVYVAANGTKQIVRYVP
jgi:hypothetical protein